MGKLRILSLSSGGGSTFERVTTACRRGEIDAEVVGLVANKKSAGCLQKAHNLGVPQFLFRLNAGFNGDMAAFGEAILQLALQVKADLVAQLGWLPQTPKNVIQAFDGMIVNQHPGPLDPGRLGFGGKGMHGKAVHAAVVHFAHNISRPFYTEATVHRVTEVVDEGALLGTRKLEVNPSHTAETLAEELLPIEHALVVSTLQCFATNRVADRIRRCPLIQPGEETLFHQALNTGIAQYPNG